ncbi:unnamed protein product [Withania somnifera]
MTDRDIDDLPRNAANYTALTPLWFLDRAATVFPNRKSLIHAPLSTRGIRLIAGAFAVIASNVPAMYEAHFEIPMAGAVLNAVNVRLNAQTIAFLLGHCSASIIMVDQEYFPFADESLKVWENNSKGKFKAPLLIVIADKNCDPTTVQYALEKGAIEYEKFLGTGDPDFTWKPPEDEWQTIALGYTSGTTASPKGVVLHHHGAYIMAMSNAVIWSMPEGAVYPWTLPLFHCNGWCFVWTLAAICGTSICLRQVTAKDVYSAIAHLGVTHFSSAPVVLNTIVNAPKEETILPLPSLVHVRTAGASSPPSVLSAMSQHGFCPSTVCTWKPEWDLLPTNVQARLNARQGVMYVCLEHLDVVSTTDMKPVPADGKTIGEIVFKGNIIMKGYLKNPKANKEAFAGGWYHSGDLAVKHPDGYIEIKDRSKEIIISGGENISSVEVENILYLHPAILEVSISPCAFVMLKPDVKKTDEQKLAEDIINFSRSKMPKFWVPKSVVFGPLPKTATGKIQKSTC